MPSKIRHSSVLLRDVPPDCTLSLQAAHRSVQPIRCYASALLLFNQYLREQRFPRAIDAIEPRHVEAFITDHVERLRPATAANRYRPLLQFFKWTVDEEDLTHGQNQAAQGRRTADHYAHTG